MKRFYKSEEKLRIVLKVLSGTIQISELCRKYDIKPARFYHWKEKLLQSSQIFDDRGRKPNIDEKIRSRDEEIARLKDVVAEITQENLALKKRMGVTGGGHEILYFRDS